MVDMGQLWATVPTYGRQVSGFGQKSDEPHLSLCEPAAITDEITEVYHCGSHVSFHVPVCIKICMQQQCNIQSTSNMDVAIFSENTGIAALKARLLLNPKFSKRKGMEGLLTMCSQDVNEVRGTCAEDDIVAGVNNNIVPLTNLTS